MPRTALLATGVAALTITLAGCGTSSPQPAKTVQPSASTQTAATSTQAPRTPASKPSDPAPKTTPPAKRAAAVVRVRPTAYGRALADRRGFALYAFTHDPPATSTCYGACAAAWPPYLVAKRPPAGDRRVGVVRRQDGRLQVSYAGRPLYHYVGDRRPGEVLCQNVTEYGGTWLVVAPDGRPIH